MEKADGLDKQDNTQEKSMGQYLKQIREEKGISLKTAAEETKIRARYLKALENDDFACLPGEVYARGFLRNYARFLGIPADEISRVKFVSPPEERQIILKQPVIKKRSSRRRPRRLLPLLLLIMGIVLAAFLLLSYFIRLPGPDSGDSDGLNGSISDQVPPGGEGDTDGEGEIEDGPTAELTLIRDTERVLEYLLSEGPITLKVKVGDSACWLRVVADGSIVADETLGPGDVREYRALTDLRGRAGNPGSLFFFVNGQDVGEVGKPGIPKDFSFSLE